MDSLNQYAQVYACSFSFRSLVSNLRAGEQHYRTWHTRQVLLIYSSTHWVPVSDAKLSEAHRRALQNGDIINIDITVYLNGWHGDNAATFPVGIVVRLPLALLSLSCCPDPIPRTHQVNTYSA